MNIVNPTPQEIDRHVLKLVARVLPGATPIYVNVVPESYAEINECFPAVEKKVHDAGGSMLLGWQIWKTPFLIEAEYHAIWQSPSGEIIDITPKNIPVSQILFLPDPEARYNGVQRDNIRQNLEKNELVDHFIALAQAQYLIKNRGDRAYQYGEIILRGEEAKLYETIQIFQVNLEVMLKTGQNIYSPCFCGGSNTYINCHGANILEALEQL
jgi:hypothetical protein